MLEVIMFLCKSPMEQMTLRMVRVTKKAMTEEIEKNIIDVLKNKTHSEYSVVYCLVECYKYLERKGELKKFDVIRFYRNWACHSHLSNDTEKVFEEVHLLIKEKTENQRFLSNPTLWRDLMTQKISESFSKYSLSILKEQIESFSHDFSNGQSIVNWENFKSELYKIIVDIPLLIFTKDDREVFRFECKRLYPPSNYKDLEISVWAGETEFSFSIGDTKLTDGGFFY